MVWTSSLGEEERDKCADIGEQTVSREVGAHLMEIRTNDLNSVILSLSITKLGKDERWLKCQIELLLIYIYIYLFIFLCVWWGCHACHDVPMEVRGQLAEDISLLILYLGMV